MNNNSSLCTLFIFIFSVFMHTSTWSQCDVNFDDENIYLENEFRKKQYAQIGTLTSGENIYKINDTLIFDLGFKKAVWVAAYGSDDSLKVAANTVVTNGKRDFVGGPVLEPGQSQNATCSFFTRVWQIKKEQLEELRENLIAGTLSEDNIPIDIWEWPAKNNQAIGDFAPSYDMAPFHDHDDNGIYDPLSGDFPIALDGLSSFIPSSFAFTVYNDDILHSSSDVDSLIIEFHQMDYFMECLDNRPLDKTIFTRLKYLYKGAMDLTDFKIGIWKLGDVGCHLDDRLGVNVDLNATYAYNTGGIDKQNCVDDSTPIPGDYGAIATEIYLNNVMDQSMYHHYNVFGSFPLNTYSPRLPIQYMHNLSSRWRDGSRIVRDSIAHDTLSTDYVNFTFPDYPTDPSGWSMQNVEAPFTNVASVTTLHEKDFVSTGYSGHIDYADHIVYDGVTEGFDIFDLYEDEVNIIKNTYLNVLYGSDYCGVSSSADLEKIPEELTVYPNPAYDILNVRFPVSTKAELSIYSILGERLLNKSLWVSDSSITLDISSMSDGVYYVVYRSNDGTQLNTSFIK